MTHFDFLVPTACDSNSVATGTLNRDWETQTALASPRQFRVVSNHLEQSLPVKSYLVLAPRVIEDSNEESLESRGEGGNWGEHRREWMFFESLLQVMQGLPGRAIGLDRWRLA